MAADVDVVVVGAGPTGLTAAGLLGRRGVRVLLVERDAVPHLLPRAVHLDDEVLRVLTGMGLGADVRAISTPGAGLRLVTRDGAVLVEFPRDPTGGTDGLPGANMFHQPDLEAVLRADVAGLPEVSVRSGVRAVAVRQRADRAEVELDDGSQVAGRAVLACDGAASPVRHQLGIGMVELGRPSTWLVVDVATTAELDEWPGVQQVCDADRAATFLRVGPLRYRWEFALRPGESADTLTVPGVLAGLLAPWLDRAPGVGWSVERSATYTFRARVAGRWREGRVFLLGDAAHQTPPFLGQGLCAGIRDAANLEWKLALVLRGAAGGELLDTYETERQPHATTVIRTAAALGRVMTARGVPAAVLRSRLLRTIAGVPGLPQRVAERAWPPLRPGPLVHRRRLGRGTAGRLCPTPEVETTGDVRRLDDVLGRGFAVLTTGAAEAVPGVRVVRLVDRAPVHPDEVCDPTGGLRRWAGAGSVLVRPDRTVLWHGTGSWPAALRRAGVAPAGLTPG